MPVNERGFTLVLGSGGARGMAHIGVLRYLEEHRIPVKAVVGCSIGAQLGAFWAAGHPASILEDTVQALGWWDSVRIFLPNRFRGGFSSGPGAQVFLARFLGNRTLESLDTPFAAVATDYHTGELVALTEGPADAAVRASIAIPGALTPVRLAGRTLMDGAASSPLPVGLAAALFGGPVLAVSVQDATPRARMPGPIGTLRHANCLLQTAIVARELREFPPDILIRPRVRGTPTMKFHATKALMEEGYRAAEDAFGELDASGESDICGNNPHNQEAVCF